MSALTQDAWSVTPECDGAVVKLYMPLGRDIQRPFPFPRYYRTGIDISLFRKLSRTSSPMGNPIARIAYVAHLSHSI